MARRPGKSARLLKKGGKRFARFLPQRSNPEKERGARNERQTKDKKTNIHKRGKMAEKRDVKRNENQEQSRQLRVWAARKERDDFQNMGLGEKRLMVVPSVVERNGVLTNGVSGKKVKIIAFGGQNEQVRGAA